MAYKIIVSPLAQIEIEDAIDYYALNSASVAKKFIIRLKETYHFLAINPFFKVQY
jgi:plasmid stabilization system protein ParE